MIAVVGIITVNAQTIVTSQLDSYYVNLRPEANYKYLQKKGYGEMIRVAKKYLETGIIENTRYSIEIPYSDNFRTGVELNPVAKENARFKWAGKRYGILDPNKRSDHILVDSQTGIKIVVGCGNVVTHTIYITLEDYDYNYSYSNTSSDSHTTYSNNSGNVYTTEDSSVTTSTPSASSTTHSQYVIEDEPNQKSSSVIVNKPEYSRKQIDFSGVGTTEQRARYLDYQIQKEDIEKNISIESKKKWKPWFLFRQVEVAPWLSVGIDAVGTTLAILGVKKLISSIRKGSHKESNFVIPRGPTDDNYHPSESE